MELALPGLIVVLVATLIPLTAFPLLHRVGRLPRADAASIAAHYGSVSVVTFAVASSFLAARGVSAEGYMVVFLVLLEFPALMIGVAIARRGSASAKWGPLLHEVFSGKSIVLLLGGLIIGWVAGADGIKAARPAVLRPLQGHAGLVPARDGPGGGRPARRPAPGRPLLAGLRHGDAAVRGAARRCNRQLPRSLGRRAVLLATLYASASYIAAPAAMRIAVPEANPAISIGAALGITFPFNLLVGIPAYHWLAIRLQGVI